MTQIAELLPGLQKASVNDLHLHAADVYLAAGCLLGAPAALSVLERDYFARVRQFVADIDRRPDFADELTQRLRERLLVPPRRKLADYAASGSLVAWLRIAARRLAVDQIRHAANEGRHLNVAVACDLVPGSANLEWDLLRARYREPFERAIQQAVAALSSRERMVLRLYLFGGANIEKIGRTYRVHRATVARWIAAAQGKIVKTVHAELAAQLGVAPHDCDSLARILLSRLSVSLTGIL